MKNLLLFIALIFVPAVALSNETGITEEYKKCLESAEGGTFDISTCVSNEYDIQVERINRAYKTILTQLGSDSERGKELLGVQKAWMEYRDAKCKYAEGEYEGSNIAPVIGLDCITHMTAERSSELEGMIKPAATKTEAPLNSSLLSTDDINDVTRSMYYAALTTGVNGMTQVENECWKHFDINPSDRMIALCSVHGFSGAFIDATFARVQMRGPTPSYNGAAVRERIISNSIKHGEFTEDHVKGIIMDYVGTRVGEVTAGLLNAGMR